MIIDSSAVVAIVLNEPERDVFISTAAANSTRMSAASLVECSVVLDNRGSVAHRRMDELLEELEVEIVPFTADQARIARHAYRRYGKGSRSPARLNLGDCFSYALSSVSGEPLLFKGEDFAHTDVLPAL